MTVHQALGFMTEKGDITNENANHPNTHAQVCLQDGVVHARKAALAFITISTINASMRNH
jgi:hypothetical protein